MAPRASSVLKGATVGLVALVVFLGCAEALAVATGPQSAPSIALGQNVIAHVPESLKNFAISHFGENDKTALLAGVYVTLVLVAALVGALASRLHRPVVAVAGAAILGALAGVSAATQPTASAVDALPSAVGALFAAGAAWLLLAPARPRRARALAPGETITVSRRHFLNAAGLLVAAGGAAYVLGRSALARGYSAVAARAAVRLPRPSSASPALADTDFDVAGLAPYLTPNEDFYRVDTALVVPQLSTAGYRLALHGLVARPATYSFDDLLAMPLIERTVTMVCVSNPVGGPYVGNARWLGVPLADLLRRAGLDPSADQLLMTSSDGMTIGADLGAIMDGRPAMLAVGMNGEPLPFEHGFPVRAIVPGVYGYASACKWLVDLEATTFAAKKAYWVQRGYAERAPIKLESKIDVPEPFARLRRGPVTVAGSAWHPTVGIGRVQVKVDGGDWHDASLAASDSPDAWRLWRWEWSATPGTHSLEVRAIDRDGAVQTARESGVVPNGASGRESVVVSVS